LNEYLLHITKNINLLHVKVKYYLQFDGYPHQTVSRTYYQDHTIIAIKDISDSNSTLIKETEVHQA
jgi:hypothetical protein